MEVLLVLIVLAVGLFIGLKFLKNFTGGTKSIINSRKKIHTKTQLCPQLK